VTPEVIKSTCRTTWMERNVQLESVLQGCRHVRFASERWRSSVCLVARSRSIKFDHAFALHSNKNRLLAFPPPIDGSLASCWYSGQATSPRMNRGNESA